jgi:Trk-type K+ transport system membrane component
MFAVTALLLVLAISLLITRVATVILTASGMSRQSARFQARSAFTSAGFTTSESEHVVNHPLRRRVVATLMLLGNAGIVAAASSAILGFRRVACPGFHLSEFLGGPPADRRDQSPSPPLHRPADP